MPRGGPRGAMRGGGPRGGGMGRGTGHRGAPSGRGGPPAVPNRGGSAPRSRPPTGGAQRMLPSSAMSHQQGPASSQPKAEGYEEYVSSLSFSHGVPFLIAGADPPGFSVVFVYTVVTHLSMFFSSFSLHMMRPSQKLPTRDMIIIIISSLHLRKSLS